MDKELKNVHQATVQGFGDEWSRFDQSGISAVEHQKMFDDYFHIFPKNHFHKNAKGMDVGCGSGRWAMEVAKSVGTLHCIDASAAALAVAKKNLQSFSNSQFYHASAQEIPLPDNSMDFGYSLGVLHHVPNTAEALKECVKKLKSGAPFLLYLYYRFDNRPRWYAWLWRLSDLFRRMISKLPFGARGFVCKVIALFVYLPLARLAKFISKLGIDAKNLPLYSYKDSSFYTMQTDALDRFGTQLEQRFTKSEMKSMMEAAGLGNITFSERMPHWSAVGYKK